MAGLDTNKISNILGTKIPQWLIRQLNTRSIQNSRQNRLGPNGEVDNLLFLSNKSSWIRLVSSIDIVNPADVEYFRRIVGDTIKDKSDLAKQFVLFGGTSKYLGNNSYGLRSGLGKDGAYGLLGDEEIKKYGYRPMPGITNVTIDTLGKLGSLRQATINFRCWDKMQLDIIDALYFKLGFTMFLEWGNTFFYSAENPNSVRSSELYSIDPFTQNLTKEEISIRIAKNIRESEGNYDAMLGLVTNFNFSYNQDGGFDCTIKLTALGILGDSIKINNPGNLPNILRDEILILSNTLSEIERIRNELPPPTLPPVEKFPNDLLQAIVKYRDIKFLPPAERTGKSFAVGYNTLSEDDFSSISFRNSGFYTRQAVSEFKIDLKNNFLNYLKIPSTARTGLTLEDIDKIPVINFYDYDYNFNNRGAYVIGRTGTIIQTDKLSEYSLILNGNDIYSKLAGPIKNYIGSSTNALTTYSIPYTGRSANSSYNFQILFYNEIYEPKINNIKVSSNITNQIPQGRIDSYVTKLIEEKLLLEKPALTISDIDENGQFKVELFYPIELPGTISRRLYYELLNQPDPGGTATEFSVTYTGKVKIELLFNDSGLIENVQAPNNEAQINTYSESVRRLEAQNQRQAETAAERERVAEQQARIEQISQALSSQSALELTLRTIHVHALSKAISNSGNNLDIGRVVYTLNIANPRDIVSGLPFYKQIFSNGIFTPFIDKLLELEGTINDADYTTDRFMNPEQRLQIHSKYGFASELMSGKDIKSFNGSQVNFKDLLKAYVVPYEINQEIVKGTSTNHPAYISLGLLLMLLNHNCTIYDSKEQSSIQTPLVYVDFNTNLNFFLSNKKQLSTNPWVTLIPFEGSFSDYQQLFNPDVLNQNKTEILPPSGSNEAVPLFKVPNDDLLSSQLPKVKFDETGNNIYRGKIMNVLLNIDYLIKITRDYSLKDGSNSIYLKTFLEQIISDINKYTGGFNTLRLSYNDRGNVYQIVDDQVVPTLEKEEALQPKDNRDNTSTIPLIGKFSIAKNLEIKTDISSKLSNMIAISANADVANKATLSTNGDNFGFINTSYRDRYISNRSEITGSKQAALDSIKATAAQFNETISDFYSKVNPSEANVSHATNYYIEKMSKIKNEEYPTRASTMIPISVNFTTDGVSGFVMGQGFTISDELLPYTYNNRVVRGVKGLEKDHINKVGFVVVGLTNTIENNQWNTSVRANMIFLKDVTEFSGSVEQLSNSAGQFEANPTNETINVPTRNTFFVATDQEAKAAAEAYLGQPMSNEEWNQLVAATFAEASRNQEEEAWVMAVILNRTRIKYLGAATVTDTLTKPRQFESVTGNAKNSFQPKDNYLKGPTPEAASSIYGAATSYLGNVPKSYLFFTSNNPAAYQMRGGLAFLDNLKKQPGSKIIGGTIFSITA